MKIVRIATPLGVFSKSRPLSILVQTPLLRPRRVWWLVFITAPPLLVHALQAGPIDDQLLKAQAALDSAFTKCSNVKFLECISTKKDGFGVSGFLARTVNERDERTDIDVSGHLTP